MNEDERPPPVHSAEPSEAEGHLRRLFTLSLDLLCVAGFDGYFKHVNPAFERVLGYGEEELLARQFIDFVHPEDRDSTLKEVANLAAGAVTVDFENRYRTKDGDYRWLAWRAAPMLDLELIYAVARDITQRKADRQLLDRQALELARSNADLEQFARVASHDLRAPLRSIVTLARFIEEDLGETVPEKTREHLAELKRRGLLLQALTDDLLVYSQAGSAREELAEVDTAELVREIAFVLDPPAGFEVVAEASLPVLETVRGPLAQVLRNLIGNSVKHHDRDRGVIRVSARRSEDRWQFAVADDGPGIGEGDRTRIFAPFELQTDSQEASAGGWGMGLSLANRVVKRFGGTMSLDARDGTVTEGSDAGADRGATFRFDWPAQIESEASRA